MRHGMRRDGPVAVVGAISGAHTLSHLYLLAYPPLFPILALYFDVTVTQLGLLVTAIYVPQLLLQLPLGVVVDRIGAKRVLVGGLLLTSLTIGLSGLAPTYPVLLACALVSGVGQSVFHPADYALIDAVTDPHNEGKAFSAHTFGGYAGFAAAPAVIGGIAIAADWRLALLAAGALGVGYTVLLAVVTPPVYARTLGDGADAAAPDIGATVREMASYVRQWDLLGVTAFYLFSMTALVGLQSFTTVLAVEGYGFDESLANTLLTAHLAATAVGVLVGGPIADRFPSSAVIVGTFGLAAGGVLIAASLGVDPGFAVPLTVFLLVGLAFGIALPSRDKLGNRTGDPDSTAARFGLYFTGLSLGAVVSPAVLGRVIDLTSAEVAFWLISGALVLAAGTIVIIRATEPSRDGQ